MHDQMRAMRVQTDGRGEFGAQGRHFGKLSNQIKEMRQRPQIGIGARLAPFGGAMLQDPGQILSRARSQANGQARYRRRARKKASGSKTSAGPLDIPSSIAACRVATASWRA